MLTNISITLAFALGIIWGLYVEKILLMALIFLFFVMQIILLKSKFYRILNYIPAIVTLLCVFLFGVLYTSYKTSTFKDKYLERRYEFDNDYNIKFDRK